MRLFVSHANADLHLAQAIRLRLEELSSEVTCFLLADDVSAGDIWEDRIRRAAEDCDGIVSVVTTTYIERPWFVAEWAVFWFQDKPWYLLLAGVPVDQVFEPMRRRQASRLEDRRDVERFLRTLMTGVKHAGALDVVAAEIVRAVRDARSQHAEATIEASLLRFVSSLERGTEDVSAAIVDTIIDAGALPRAVELTADSDNSVSLRQFASLLVERGHLAEAETVAAQIPNNAERRSVGLVALARLGRDPRDQATVRLVHEIYTSVRDPQRRDLRDAAMRRDVDIRWPELPPRA